MTSRRLAWGIAGLLLLGAAAAQAVRGGRQIWASAAVRAVAALAGAQGAAMPPAAAAGALRLLDDAVSASPAAVVPRAARADLLFVLGRRDEAIRAYRDVLAFEPRAEVWFNLGLALWADGDRQEARDALRKGIALDPRLADALPSGAFPVAPKRRRGR